MLINAKILSWVGVTMISCHQVTMVFHGPTWGAFVCSRHHELSVASRHVTNSTRSIMVVKVGFMKGIVSADLVFGAIDIPCWLMARFIITKFRRFSYADIISGSSYVGIVFSSNTTWNIKMLDILLNWLFIDIKSPGVSSEEEKA